VARKKQPEKRSYGEGTIFQREDGLWVGRKTVMDMDGKRKPKTKYGKTYDEVKAKLDDITDALAAGLIVSTKEQTTTEFLEMWLADVVTPNLAPKTIRSYKDTTEKHITPYIGTVPLRSLTAQHVQRMLTAVTKKVSAIMASRCRRVLRAALTYAVKWQLVTRNVAALTDPPKVAHREMQSLDLTEARAFLKAVANDRMEGLYVLAITTGLRQGELLGLRWQDVDLERGVLAVRNQLQRVTGKGLRLRELKTEKSRRTLTLPATAVDALKRHRVRQLEARLWAGITWQDTGFIFTSSKGTPADPDHTRCQFKKLLKNTNLTPVRFHGLRHTFASLLVAQGGNFLDLSKMLGHSQPSTTSDTYSHLFDGRYAELAAMMDSALTGTD